MDKEFVPYELVVKLKELGFDGKCFGAYNQTKILNLSLYLSQKDAYQLRSRRILAPTWQQAFDWLRIKHNIFIEIIPTTYGDNAVFIKNVFGQLLVPLTDNLFKGAYDVTYTYEEALESGILKSLELINICNGQD